MACRESHSPFKIKSLVDMMLCEQPNGGPDKCKLELCFPKSSSAVTLGVCSYIYQMDQVEFWLNALFLYETQFRGWSSWLLFEFLAIAFIQRSSPLQVIGRKVQCFTSLTA